MIAERKRACPWSRADASEMAGAIEDLLRDPTNRSRLEANARRRVERDYDWDVIARRQAQLYGELMSYNPQNRAS